LRRAGTAGEFGLREASPPADAADQFTRAHRATISDRLWNATERPGQAHARPERSSRQRGASRRRKSPSKGRFRRARSPWSEPRSRADLVHTFVVVCRGCATLFRHSADLARTWAGPKSVDKPGHRGPTGQPPRHQSTSTRPGTSSTPCRSRSTSSTPTSRPASPSWPYTVRKGG
jgi:hypothetical protein